MRNNVELLAPARDFECLKAAVQSGANCVYFGANLFNARASATNFDSTEMKKAIEYAKLRNVKTNLALNVLIKNDEFSDAIELAKQAYEYGIDAIIVQDIGLAKKLIELFPDLPIHASTQMTIHNLEGALEAEKLGFKRVVLSRELNINQIKYICENSNIETEVFVHGALCISYSGQCLLSSMIGGRSGNRGKCAQPCRLPYELVESTGSEAVSTIDKGYLLSTKDLCALNFIPLLIKYGVTSFKIEGRLKNPEYVSTVTRIYRKYIDLANSSAEAYEIDENDKKDLLQVFNRGGFSCGYLDAEPNSGLIYKRKPNNMGIYIGKVSNFNPNKGYVTVRLEGDIEIGDSVSLEREKGSYTISELMLLKSDKDALNANMHITKQLSSKGKDNNVSRADSGQVVKLGRIKGNISVGDKIYKLASKQLNANVSNLILSENIKNIINCRVIIRKNQPVSMEIYTNCNSEQNGIFDNIDFSVKTDLVPIDAINAPITKERIAQQINKLGNSPFEFGNIDIELDENLYIPSISKLNQLRRDCICKLEDILLSKIHRKAEKDVNATVFEANKPVVTTTTNSSKKVSVLLNVLHTDYDYSKLENIDRLYVPLKYFCNADKLYTTIVTDLCAKFNVYIYMPSIFKNYEDTSFERILSTYNVKGFVISNLSQFFLLEEYKNAYDFIANYNLNVYNNNAIFEICKLGASCITISPELDKENINNMCSYINSLEPNTLRNEDMRLNLSSEVMVYGNLPVMTTNYCLLSKSNSCLKNCKDVYCANNNKKFYLKDRMGLHFRIKPDSFNGTTTIYNTKKTSISCDNLCCNYIRLDFIDEDITDINEITELALDGDILQGKDFTNGNFNRLV